MAAKPEKVIQVIARFRPPLFADEIGQPFCVKFQGNSVFVLHEKLKRTMQFDFDGALPPETTQEQVYQKVGAKLLQDVFAGFNCTLMTYGQTGSGKSYTMEGKNFKDLPDLKEGESLDPQSGVVPRLIEDLFDTIKAQQKLHPQNAFDVGASYVEVYRGDLVDCIHREEAKSLGWKIHDATDSKTGKVEVRFPNGATNEVPRLCGQTIIQVTSKAQLRKVYQMGCGNRVVEATNANPVSSRGHGIFDITLTQTIGLTSTRTSLFRIVDLAGSEQAENTGQDAARQREAKTINTSLAMLGGVVLGLSQNDQFINYRRDILTRVLEESLSKGNKSILVVTGKPTANNVKSTLNSLRFASTASFVQGTIFANEKQSRAQLERGIADRDAALKAKEDELAELRLLLEKGTGPTQDAAKQEELLVAREREQAALKEELEQLKAAAAAEAREMLKARTEEMQEAHLKAKEEEIASLRAKEGETIRAKELEIAELREKMAQLMQDFSNRAEDAVDSPTEVRAENSGLKGSDASEKLQDDLRLALARMEELEAALATKERQHAEAQLAERTVAERAEQAPPSSVVSSTVEVSAEERKAVEPTPTFVHSSASLKDTMRDQLMTQPAAYEAENVLNLIPDPLPEDALPDEGYLAELLPPEARDGKLQNGSRVLISGLMFVLVDKGSFRHACPDSLFSTCPTCEFTRNRSAAKCANCERKRKFMEDGPQREVLESEEAEEKCSLPPSEGSTAKRSWATGYFEISVELQSLLIFHRKVWPQLGDTVKCSTNSGERTGIVRFSGPTSFAAGDWIGLELKTPSGKNDGSVKGVTYFSCGPNYGLFVQRAAIIDEQQANCWELTDSVPLVHSIIQPLTDCRYSPNAFALHTATGIPWVFRTLSSVAYSRWQQVLSQNSLAWSEEEYRINRLRAQMTTVFVSGMLRLLRADGSGWQKLVCQVRAADSVFECFDVAELETALEKAASPVPVCVCPIADCEVSRVSHQGTGPKRYVFMLRPKVSPKSAQPSDPAPSPLSLSQSSAAAAAAAASAVASAFSKEAKTRALSFLATSSAKIKQTAQRYTIPSSRQDGEAPPSSCLLLLADTEREMERWVGSLEVFQQFHAPAPSKGRRRDSIMMADSRLEGFMRTKQNKVLATWHSCYCVLTRNGQLQMYQSKHKWGAGQIFMLTTMTIKEMQLSKGQDKSKGFQFTPKDGKEGFFLGCVDQADHQAWLEALKS